MKTPQSSLRNGATRASPSAAEEFDLNELLGYRLVRLSTSLGNMTQRETEELAGVTLPEYRVLVVLHSGGPSGVVALQQAMLIDKAWISRTLASLAAKGLVDSEADPSDARRTVFSVTPKGRRAARLLIEQALERQERIMRGFTHAEVQQLKDLLTRIQTNVDDAAA